MTANRPGFTPWPQSMWTKYLPNVAKVYLAIASFPADLPVANSAIAAKAGVGHNVVDRAKRKLIAGGDLETTYSLESGKPTRHRFPTVLKDDRGFAPDFTYEPVPNWLWHHDLDPGPFMLWVALRHYRDLPYGIIPKLGELTKKTKTGRASLLAHRQTLVDAGLVRIEKRGRGVTDRYTLVEPETASTSGYSAAQSPVGGFYLHGSPAMRVGSEAMRGRFSSDADNRLNIQPDTKTDPLQTENQHDHAREASPHGRVVDKRSFPGNECQDLAEDLVNTDQALVTNHLEEARESLPGKKKNGSAPVSPANNIFGRQAPVPNDQPFPCSNPAMARVRASLDRDKSAVAQHTEHHTAESVEGHTHCRHCGREEVAGIDRFQRPICMDCHSHGLGHIAPNETHTHQPLRRHS